MDIEVKVPKGIDPNSWLNEPRFEWFKKAYQYASTQTLAIPALSASDPEDLYYATRAFLRSMGVDPEAP